MPRRGSRDVLWTLALLVLLLALPTAYAGKWPPAVVVESSSMMHADAEVSYGRVGTIDPGDLVLVKDVDAPEDVATFVDAEGERYGARGDVIVYRPAGDPARTPIIHRAMAYVEVVERDGERAYRVRWAEGAPCEGGARKEEDAPGWCVYGPRGVLIPSASVFDADGSPYAPTRTGFITKGDNPATNARADPFAGISVDERGRPSTVPIEWVEGKARGELPWLGLVKLALAGEANEDSPPASYVRIGWAYAPPDLWVMLAVSLGAVIGLPMAWDFARARRWRRRGEGDGR